MVLGKAAAATLLLGLGLGAVEAAGVELKSGFALLDGVAEQASAVLVDSSPLPVGTTMCHGGTKKSDPPCYCNPNQNPAPECVYNGAYPNKPCPNCGADHCLCPLAGPPAPPTPSPPAPPSPPPPGPAPSIPVGTISNGTCVPAPYHGTDCDTHASGYFSGLATLAACAAKVKPCKMGNYISYGADKSCSWYSQCDFAHLCKDCSASKDTGPNCPASVGLPKCPHYIAFTSEVLKIAPPAPPPAPPPSPAPTPGPPGPMPDGCHVVTGTDYKFAPGGIFAATPTYPHGMRPVDTPAQCCTLCKSFKNCSLWTYENGGTAAKPQCYQYKQACCILKTAAAHGGGAHSTTSISGSMKAVEAITCRDGTQCGGTNEWTTWHDATLPNR